MSKIRCQYCNKKTGMPAMYYAMTPIDEKIEKRINELGRDNWFEEVNWDNPTDELDQIALYDQLINTFGKAVVCKKCLDKDSKLWEKYYPQQCEEI